jgi:hypothetical protein
VSDEAFSTAARDQRIAALEAQLDARDRVIAMLRP